MAEPAGALPESPEPQTRLVLEVPPPPGKWWRRALPWLLYAAIGLANAGLVAGLAAYAHFAKGLPSIPSVDDWKPLVVSELVSGDGQLAGEFFIERRKVVPYDRVPKKLIQAFIASEDQHFFEHSGIDILGTLRAAFQTFVLHHKVQGGSTLTQQTAKSLLVTAQMESVTDERIADEVRRRLGKDVDPASTPYKAEWIKVRDELRETALGKGAVRKGMKGIERKVKELILARRLERSLTKEQILYLYLNTVYLGHHSYGVQAAAENYYRKNVEDLTLPEAALIAGLPQAPTKYSPFAHPESAKDRRKYVLRRMYEERMISKEEREAAEKAEVKVFPLDDVFRETAPFYAETVRREIVDRYGNDRLLQDGLRIETAMDLEKQRDAQEAVIRGLYAVDKRQGFWGPVEHVEGKEAQELEARLARAWPAGSLGIGDYAVGVVSRVDDPAGLAEVRVGGDKGVLPIAGMRWARKPNPEAYYPNALISRPSTALKAGDVVVVRRVRAKDLELEKKESVPEAAVLLSLEQTPRLQAALVSIDPTSGYVAAMVGGYDFEDSEFNRAFQACRQPGSSFKPIVYSAAIEKLNYTPATIITDAPIVYRDEDSGVSWKPQNFEEEFKGDVTVRTALVNSMNIPAVKVAAAVGMDKIIPWAHQLGLTTPVKNELGSAIGSSCTTLWDITNVYATLDRYGVKKKSHLVKRVLDREGNVLEDHSDWRDPWVPLSSRLASAYAAVEAPQDRVMDEKTAAITVHLMHEVATVGTGAQAARLGKPAAGKTGTTNDSFDVWFIGFTRDLVSGVWVGFDHNEQPLGRYETGSRGALPIWLDYMQRALKGRPQADFPVPDGIVLATIDPDTGKRLPDGDKKGVEEPFVQGTEPPLDDKTKPQVDTQSLFNQ